MIRLFLDNTPCIIYGFNFWNMQPEETKSRIDLTLISTKDKMISTVEDSKKKTGKYRLLKEYHYCPGD